MDSLPAELPGKSLQVEECQVLPENHQKPGERRGTHYLSEQSEGTNPANILISDLQPLELWDNSFSLHKPSSLRDFAMAALANWLGFPGNSESKESACNVGDMGSIPGLGRSPGGGHGNPLQYSCLENPRGQRSLAGSRGSRRVVTQGFEKAKSTYSCYLNAFLKGILLVGKC